MECSPSCLVEDESGGGEAEEDEPEEGGLKEDEPEEGASEEDELEGDEVLLTRLLLDLFEVERGERCAAAGGSDQRSTPHRDKGELE